MIQRFLQALGRSDVVLDLHLYGGIGIAAFGGWQLSHSWTLVSVGLALVALGVWSQRKGTP